MDFGRCDISNIKITSTINKRFIVRVGCGAVACNDAEEVVDFLKEYLSDREGVRRKVHGPADKLTEAVEAQPQYPSPYTGDSQT